MRERPADGEDFLATLDLDLRLSAKVARDRFDGLDVDDGRAVDLPKLVGVEAFEQFLDRRLDQRLQFRCRHAGVFFVRLEKQYLFNRDEAQVAADGRLDPGEPPGVPGYELLRDPIEQRLEVLGRGGGRHWQG